MDEIIEHGYASEYGQLAAEGVEGAFGERKKKQGRSDGHKNIEQGRRIFGDIEERQDGEKDIVLNLPGVRISIKVRSAQKDKNTHSRPTQVTKCLFQPGRALVQSVQSSHV